MRRKTIQLAGKTLVISLPSAWVKQKGIKKGEELEVSQSGTSIVIERPASIRGQSAVIDISGLNASLVWHTLVSSYVSGAGEIEVRFRDSFIHNPRTAKQVSTSEIVEGIVDGLIGMEIVRHSKGIITIKEVSSVIPEEYPNVVRRIWLTCLSMADDSASALRTNDAAALDSAVRVEKNINRLVLYALRMLHRGVPATIGDSIVDARMIYSLEAFADVISSTGKKSDAQSLSLAADALRHAYECWFKPSNEKASVMYSALMSLRAKKDKYPAIVHSTEAVVEAAAASAVKIV